MSARVNSAVSTEEENGITAWLYDSVTDQFSDSILSVGLDGYASSSVSWLTQSGVLLGSYQLFSEDGADLGQRLFYFDTQYGLFDLAELVLRGRNDWDSLLSVVTATEQGQIIVTGTLSNSNIPVYFPLTPVFP